MGLANDIKSSDLTALQLTHGAELEVLASYKVSLKRINGELAEAYRKYSENGKTLTMAEVSKYGRLAKLEDAIITEVKTMTGETIRSTDRAIEILERNKQ